MPNSALPDPESLDRHDPLRSFRDRFELPLQADGRTPAIYLCGNSLGPMPRAVRERVQQTLDDWALLGVRGHHDGPRPWIPYAESVAPPLAELVGADALDVVLMNSLTANLHLLMASFYRPTPARCAILIEQGAFPSDQYAIDSQIRFHGHDPRTALVTVAPRNGEDLLRTGDILATIAKHAGRLALILLPGVQYRTGQVLDMERISAAGKAAGAVVGWDLAHAVGNAPLQLAAWDVDFAVWCSYKYLCAGPGAIAGAYVHARYREAFELPRLAGWWGHDKATRFEMGPQFRPMPGAGGWQLSNPPILSTAPLAISLALYREAGFSRLRAKSVALTGYAQAGIAALLQREIECITPQVPAERGCQLSLRVRGGRDRARKVYAALSQRGIVGDWREPDVIRIAPHPLYNTYADVATCLRELREVTACT
ncbi:MAG: kynureninase [Steroidobacterales bacterium]